MKTQFNLDCKQCCWKHFSLQAEVDGPVPLICTVCIRNAGNPWYSGKSYSVNITGRLATTFSVVFYIFCLFLGSLFGLIVRLNVFQLFQHKNFGFRSFQCSVLF